MANPPRNLRAVIRASIIATSLLLFTGCGPSERNTGLEKQTAISSPLTFDEGVALAKVMVEANRDKGWSWAMVSDTGSMEPVLNSSTVVVLMPSDGADVQVRDVVTYVRGSAEIIHEVAAANATHFIPDGVANERNDGWVPRSAITRVAVSTIYTRGRQ